jgi:PhnB protein
MVTPYITFPGNCREALELYSAVFGAEVSMLYPYGDYVPEGLADVPQNLKDWVLHAVMVLAGTEFWFADEVGQPVTAGTMVKLTAKVPSSQAARRIFDALADRGRVTLPPTDTFYSTFHAGVVDRFGVSWQIVAEEAPGAAEN